MPITPLVLYQVCRQRILVGRPEMSLQTEGLAVWLTRSHFSEEEFNFLIFMELVQAGAM